MDWNVDKVFVLISDLKSELGQYFSLLLLTGSNFSDFGIILTFRVLILAILDFNHKTH